MGIVVCPGSFDPITLGHLDIITRASALFEQVIVLVVINPEKNPSFTPQERCDMIKKSTTHLSNVCVDNYQGLLANYIKQSGATAIVKGLRAMSDFEYEFQMALTNRKLLPEAETVFFATAVENMYLNSSLVKQVSMFGGNIDSFVPAEVLEQIKKRLCAK